MSRFRREDWLALGLAALADAGPEALTVEALCARAQRTRGSFYHHFSTMEAFIAALADFWRERDTEAIIRSSSVAGTAEDRLDALNDLTSRLDPRLEQGVRRLAAREVTVAQVCRAVDRRRIGHLIKLYGATGDFAPADSELLAQVVYAAFVGFQSIAPEMRPEAARDAYGRLIALVTRRAAISRAE